MVINQMSDVDAIAQAAEGFISSGRFADRVNAVIEEDPWSQVLLDSCESFFLNHVHDYDDQMKFEYLMFLGEGLRRSFAGQWKKETFSTDNGNEKFDLLGIYYPHSQHYDVVSNLLDHACEIATGTTWSSFFKVNELYFASINNPC